MKKCGTSSRAKCIPINGPMLQSEANEIPMKCNFNNFTVSNVWLKSFCARYQTKFSSLHGKPANVLQDAMNQQMLELPKLAEGYSMCDIFNCSEMIYILFKALPQKTLLGPTEKPVGKSNQKRGFPC